MLNVRDGFVQAQRRKRPGIGKPPPNPCRLRFLKQHPEPWLSYKDDRQQSVTLMLQIRQRCEFGEVADRQVLGLIDDEDRAMTHFGGMP